MNPPSPANGFPEETCRSKREHRKRLAALPIEEKLAIIMRMQQLAWEISHSAGRTSPLPWKLD
jgi:hypothetical protein